MVRSNEALGVPARARGRRHHLGGATTKALAAATAALLAVPALSVLPASAATLPAATRPAAPVRLVRFGLAPQLPAGAHVVATPRATERLSGALALKPRDPAALAAYAASVTNPHSTLYKHYLARGRFETAFGPTKATLSAATSALRHDGLDVTGVSGNGMLVNFSGSVARVSRAFDTRLADVRLASGHTALTNLEAPALPSTLGPEVQSVLGLSDVATPVALGVEKPAFPRPAGLSGARPGKIAEASTNSQAPQACAAANEAASLFQGVTDSTLAGTYGLNGLYDAGDLGGGQTIAIYELEPFYMSDIVTFDKCFFPTGRPGGLPNVIAIDGGQPHGESSGEATLDIEDISALAPDATIDVYEAPGTTYGSIDQYNAMVTSDTARVLSTSWGFGCETQVNEEIPGYQQLEENIFEQAAIQGQTLFSAAGDDGDDGCAGHEDAPVAPDLSVSDPADFPYVVSVGGTTMTETSEPPQQVVWNDGAQSGAGGGGISQDYAMPSWQLNAASYLGVASNPYTTGAAAATYEACDSTANDGAGLAPGTLCREEPDVSALADEYTGITVFGQEFDSYGLKGWATIGGTSEAAPTWAAILTDIDASSYCGSGADPVGFASPALYGVASTSQAEYLASFTPITEGNNDVFGNEGGAFEANPAGGYSMAAGLGTPDVTNPGVTSGVGQGLAYNLCTFAAPSSTTRPIVSAVVNSSTPSDANSGPLSGGNLVTITGTNLAGATSVSFGSTVVSGAAITADSATSVTVTAPARQVGPAVTFNGGSVPVEVTTPGGTSAPSAAAQYVYTATAPDPGAPTVDGVSPYGGPQSGDFADGGAGPVTIFGSGFTGATSVSFGGVPVASGNFTVNAAGSEISVTRVPAYSSATLCATGTPISDVCQVQVVVTNAIGSSATATILPPDGSTLANGTTPADEEGYPAATEYDYFAPPVISSITEDGSQFGDDETITGTGFDELGTQWVNMGPATESSSEAEIVANTSTEITFETLGVPSPGVEPVTVPDVTLQTMAGLSNAVSYTYSGNPVVTGLSVSGGLTTGGETLTITGQGFTGAGGVGDGVFNGPAVQFMSDVFGPATVYLPNVTSVSSTTISLTTPANLPGPYDVEVCTASSCSSPNPPADTYTYSYPGVPVLAAVVSPTTGATVASGPAHGANTVALVGSDLSGAVAVHFGTVAATTFSNVANILPSGNPNELQVVVPPGVAGSTVAITVTTDGGANGAPVTSPTSGAPTYHYLASTPSGPASVTATAAGGTVAASFTAPASDGGSPVTHYVAKLVSHPEVAVLATRVLPASATSVGFLAPPGTSDTVNVTAYNARGMGLTTVSSVVSPTLGDNGYLVVGADGNVVARGSLVNHGSFGDAAAMTAGHVVGIAATPDAQGYWVATASGAVQAFGDAKNYGDLYSDGFSGLTGSHPIDAPIVAIVANDRGSGYWLVNELGQVFTFGATGFYGDSHASLSPVVGMAVDAAGTGYWIATSDGAVLDFGSAKNLGGISVSGERAVVGIAATPKGMGYWLVSRDGALANFGNAGRFGDTYSAGFTGLRGAHRIAAPIVAMVVTPGGHGYWFVAMNGTVYHFGTAQNEGPAGRSVVPAVGGAI